MQERERALHLPAWRHAAATQSTRVGEFADEPPSLHSPSKSPRAAQPLPGPHSTFTGECTELSRSVSSRFCSPLGSSCCLAGRLPWLRP